MTSPFEVLDSAVVHRGYMSEVRAVRLRAPDGSEVTREITGHVDAVAIVAVDAQRRAVLVHQYRHAIGEHLLEVPAGMLDVDGESRVDAAARELAEEVGLAAGRWQELTSFHNSAGWTDETTTIYLAEDLGEVDVPDGFAPDAEEADMTVLRLPLDDAVALVRAGRVPDAKTALGLLLAAERV